MSVFLPYLIIPIDNLIGTKDADIVSPEFAKMSADTDAQVVATKESVS